MGVLDFALALKKQRRQEALADIEAIPKAVNNLLVAVKTRRQSMLDQMKFGLETAKFDFQKKKFAKELGMSDLERKKTEAEINKLIAETDKARRTEQRIPKGAATILSEIGDILEDPKGRRLPGTGILGSGFGFGSRRAPSESQQKALDFGFEALSRAGFGRQTYQIGQIIDVNGVKHRVVGFTDDPSDPQVEEVR